MIKYIKDLFSGMYALLQGMYITNLNFWRPKVTEQYPEDRQTARQFERFRGELVFDMNDQNEHKCIACGLCARNCPNQSLEVITKSITTEDGKTKKVLDKFLYDLGSCTFCSVCTQSCAQKAIKWSNNFEHAVFNRSALVKQLNPEGSKAIERKPVVAAPKAAPAAGQNENQQ